jgi:hypothetical protein
MQKRREVKQRENQRKRYIKQHLSFGFFFRTLISAFYSRAFNFMSYLLLGSLLPFTVYCILYLLVITFLYLCAFCVHPLFSIIFLLISMFNEKDNEDSVTKNSKIFLRKKKWRKRDMQSPLHTRHIDMRQRLCFTGHAHDCLRTAAILFISEVNFLID